jgi:hypothetical protein
MTGACGGDRLKADYLPLPAHPILLAFWLTDDSTVTRSHCLKSIEVGTTSLKKVRASPFFKVEIRSLAARTGES